MMSGWSDRLHKVPSQQFNNYPIVSYSFIATTHVYIRPLVYDYSLFIC